MSDVAVASLGFVGVAVAMVVDGRHGVVIATAAVALGLVGGIVSIAGSGALLALLIPALAAGPLSHAASNVARRSAWVGGLDPLVPVISSREKLFGPRSLRAAAGAAALPAASWVSFNLPIGGLAVVHGELFATAYAWLCGAARLLLAGTVEDLAVGGGMVSIAGAATWVVQGGAGALTEAALIGGLAPACAVTAAWLGGRHARRAEGSP